MDDLRPPLKDTETAYLAGVLDARGIVRVRVAGDTMLPFLGLHTPNLALLGYVAEVTGTKVTETRRSYYKVGCSEHCAQKHQHVQSVSGRWSVTGARATVVLHNVVPYFILQRDTAQQVLTLGLAAPMKAETLVKMEKLGWSIPKLTGDTSEGSL